MLILKFPINSFGSIPQSNHPSPKTLSLKLLIFFKFSFTSHLKKFFALCPIVFCHDCSIGIFVPCYVQLHRAKDPLV
ncbi:hypothetical protein ACE6H2_017148 [Prunus campanulata]